MNDTDENVLAEQIDSNATVESQPEGEVEEVLEDSPQSTDESELTDDSYEQEPEEDPDDDQEDLTPGIKKRIAKLKAKHAESEAKIRAEFDAKFAEIEYKLRSGVQAPNPYDPSLGMMQNNPYQQPAFMPDPAYSYPGQQNAPATFEQFKVWKQQAEIEEKQRKEQEEIKAGLDYVYTQARTRGYQDPEFTKLVKDHGHLINNNLAYALKGIKNPASFIKHVLKNDKDRAMLLQLQGKNVLEQVAEFSKWASRYEAQSIARKNAEPSPQKARPIPPLKAGAMVQGRKTPGVDVNNPSTWTSDNVARFMNS